MFVLDILGHRCCWPVRSANSNSVTVELDIGLVSTIRLDCLLSNWRVKCMYYRKWGKLEWQPPIRRDGQAGQAGQNNVLYIKLNPERERRGRDNRSCKELYTGKGDPIWDEAKVLYSFANTHKGRAVGAHSQDSRRAPERRRRKPAEGRERANDCQARHAGPDWSA